jgi:hypothetical protein
MFRKTFFSLMQESGTGLLVGGGTLPLALTIPW